MILGIFNNKNNLQIRVDYTMFEYFYLVQTVAKVTYTLYRWLKSPSSAIIIGSGGFGSVYKIKRGGKYIASKYVPNVFMFNNEVKIHKLVSSRFTPKYIRSSIWTRTIYMEHCKYSMSKCMRSSRHDKLKWIVNIVEGLCHLEKCGIIHRDLKEANILITFDGKAVIADFGLSVKALRVNRYVGTFGYIAPEVKTGSYDNKVDIYSTGVLCTNLLSPDLVVPDCIQRCLCLNPSDRPTPTELLSSIRAIDCLKYTISDDHKSVFQWAGYKDHLEVVKFLIKKQD